MYFFQVKRGPFKVVSLPMIPGSNLPTSSSQFSALPYDEVINEIGGGITDVQRESGGNWIYPENELEVYVQMYKFINV